MECCGGLAQNVITTIGQAFELRLKECLRRDPANSSAAAQDSSVQASSVPMPAVRGQRRPDDVEYYNDMPGKRPPPTATQASSSSPPQWSKKDSLSSNLIDFSDAASCSASRQIHAPVATAGATSTAGPEYVNGVVAATTATKPSGFSRENRPDPVGIPLASATSGKDPFDMSKLSLVCHIYDFGVFLFINVRFYSKRSFFHATSNGTCGRPCHLAREVASGTGLYRVLHFHPARLSKMTP